MSFVCYQKNYRYCRMFIEYQPIHWRCFIHCQTPSLDWRRSVSCFGVEVVTNKMKIMVMFIWYIMIRNI